MSFQLTTIQDTVQEYAKVIAQVSGVDVEVVDNRLYRVAGTGLYAGEINQDMSTEGYVYKHILSTGETKVIYDPGKDSLCCNCPSRNNCQETVEISMPIKVRDEIIGVIGLVGSTVKQRDMLIKRETLYLEFVSQMANFIAAKAIEEKDKEVKTSIIATLDSIINHMDQGVLLVGNNGIVRGSNESAKKQLGITSLEGMNLEIVSTGDKLINSSEFILKIGDIEVPAMGEIYPLGTRDDQYTSIFVFKSIKTVHSDLYDVTSFHKGYETKNIIGKSHATLTLIDNIGKIAESNSTVLITGESGTGKEMVASAIWRKSDRRDQRFVAVNCAAIPDALLESELFGYVKGAFSGADPKGRIGKFELANQGVIFLDEIGDMPIYLQAKILRVLQEKTITRIGSNQLIPVDIRVLAATNKDLKQMMQQKKFREDLYYRLNVIPLHIKPLRERTEDVEDLANYFIARYSKLLNKPFTRIETSTMNKLKVHSWEGNVRELENTIEFMVNMMDRDGVIRDNTLPMDFFHDTRKTVYPTEDAESITPLKELEYKEILKASRLYGDSTEGKKQAAESLGISLATYYRRLFEIEASDFLNMRNQF